MTFIVLVYSQKDLKIPSISLSLPCIFLNKISIYPLKFPADIFKNQFHTKLCDLVTQMKEIKKFPTCSQTIRQVVADYWWSADHWLRTADHWLIPTSPILPIRLTQPSIPYGAVVKLTVGQKDALQAALQLNSTPIRLITISYH